MESQVAQSVKRVHLVRQAIKSFIPSQLQHFYTELRRDPAFIDRSEVVLYATPAILPDYRLRVDPGAALADRKSRLTVSLITTVLNEAHNVTAWIASLQQQKRLPDEVIITDGGSRDGTFAALQELSEAFTVPLRIISAPGYNIAAGRNLAIQSAAHPIIASTDFGCSLDPDWLERLILPFETDPEIGVSAGYYQVVGERTLERLSAHFFGVDLAKVNPGEFLPSSRSLAFRRELWSIAGGYPEWLTDAGEDTLFDYHLKSQPARWAFVPEAVVQWHAPRTIQKLVKTYYRYAFGDGENGTLGRHYRYKIIQFTRSFLRRSLLLLTLALLVVWLGAWLLPIIAFIVGIGLVRWARQNQAISKALNVPGWLFNIIDEVLSVAQAIGFARGVANRPRVYERKVAHYQQALSHILSEHPQRKNIIVYPSTHDWGFMFQRPHQIARAFARQGFLYVYCTNNELTDSVYGFQSIEPNLLLANVPIETFSNLESPIVYIGSPWHRSTLDHFHRPRVIYDHYDDLEVSGGKQEDHRWLSAHADVMLTTSRILLEKAMEIRRDILFVPNGVDVEYILASRPTPDDACPPDWEIIQRNGAPVIGYSGALAEWFDYELVKSLSMQRPDWQFVLIGIDYDGSLAKSGLLEFDNVYWLGMKPYQQLFQYVWRFDVGTIPFKVNDITLATSPIKLFEYMACCKPVVSTALPECKGISGVSIAENAVEFRSMLETALKIRSDIFYQALLQEQARANTWERRVETIIRDIEGVG
jgi:glycosyltransferase involved in cell wall biosynthesis